MIGDTDKTGTTFTLHQTQKSLLETTTFDFDKLNKRIQGVGLSESWSSNFYHTISVKVWNKPSITTMKVGLLDYVEYIN